MPRTRLPDRIRGWRVRRKAWAELLDRIRNALLVAKRFAFLLDFDGTVAEPLEDATKRFVSRRTRRILTALLKYALVAIVTGRGALEALDRVGVRGATYYGDYGATCVRPGEKPELLVEPSKSEGDLTEFLDGFHLDEHEIGYPAREGINRILQLGTGPEAKKKLEVLKAIEAAAPGAGFVTRWGHGVLNVSTVDIEKRHIAAELVRRHRFDFVVIIGDEPSDVGLARALRGLLPEGHVIFIGVLEKGGRFGKEITAEADYTVTSVAGVVRCLAALLKLVRRVRGRLDASPVT